MTTIENDNILKGTITHKVRDYPKGEFILKPGVTITEGDSIELDGIYSCHGYQDVAFIFKGTIEEVDYLSKQKITAEGLSEEIENRPTATYYGRMGGLVQDLLDNELQEITHSLSSSSPYNYRAPHNFRNIADDGFPTTYWSKVGTPLIVSYWQDHKKVMKFEAHLDEISHSVDYLQTGSLEWYAGRNANNSGRLYFFFDDSYHNGGFTGYFSETGYIIFWDGAGFTNIQTYNANQMYKFKIIFYCDTMTYDLYIDDVLKGNYDMDDNAGFLGINRFRCTHSTTQGAGISYFDAFGWVEDLDYELGLNALKEYDQLDYTSEWQKWALKGDKTIRSIFDMYVDATLQTWYVDPVNEIYFNDADVDSGVDIDVNKKTMSIKGKKQIKIIDKVILKGGYSGAARLYSIQGSGSNIYRDTYGNVTDQLILDKIAGNLLTTKSENPITITIYLHDPSVGFVQPGETLSIVAGMKFSNSTTEIPAGQYIIRQIKYYMVNGQYNKIDLILDDGLVFHRDVEVALPQENSDLIGLLAGGETSGEANIGQNVGTDGYGVYSGKAGSTLQFRNVAPGSSKITTTLNGNDIDIDVSESDLSLANLGSKSYSDLSNIPSTFTPSAHTHDGDTLQNDGINSNGGTFDFLTSGALNLRPSGVTIDYLQLYTDTGTPRIKIIGGGDLLLESDNIQTALMVMNNGQGIGFWNYNGGTRLFSTKKIEFQPNSENTNYIEMYVTSTVPYISFTTSGYIKNVHDPSDDQDAATKKYVDDIGGVDTNAIHKSTDGEIYGITVKTPPVGSDVLLMEDSAASWAKKKVTVSDIVGLAGGYDANAIHDNETGEINAITSKSPIVDGDQFIIEDSAASYAKKSVLASVLKTHVTPTLDQAFDKGKIIDGANSLANAFQVGGSYKWSFYNISNIIYATISNAHMRMGTTALYNVIFETNGTERWYLDTVGCFQPAAGNAYDIGTSSHDVRYLYYCNMSDSSCADFSNLTAGEIYQLFKQIQPRTDDIKHEISNGLKFPHIDFSTLPDEFATKADKDFTKENVSTDLGKTTIEYKKGDNCGIEMGNMVYAMKDLIVKQQEKIQELEARLASLENK